MIPWELFLITVWLAVLAIGLLAVEVLTLRDRLRYYRNLYLLAIEHVMNRSGMSTSAPAPGAERPAIAAGPAGPHLVE